MSRYRSILLFAAAVTAFAACGPNNSTSSVTTGKSTASASISPQPVAAPSTSAAPMIPAPSGSGAYPTHPLRFKSGQATVKVDGGTADGSPLGAMSFSAGLDQSSTDSFNPKTGEFNLRWVDENGHGLEVDGTAPRHGNIDAFVRIDYRGIRDGR